MVYGDTMKFKQYINEVDLSFLYDDGEVELIAEKLKKDCMPFIKEMKKVKPESWIYRATESVIKDIKKIKPRTNRRPRNMPEELHTYMNMSFKKHFGWKPRSEGVFTSSDYWQLEHVYGNVYMFFPIGNYKYVYHPHVIDIYMFFDQIYNISMGGKYIKIDKMKKKFNDIFLQYTDKNLKKAYYGKVEITFKCKSYFLVNRKYEDVLKENIYGLK